MAFPRDAVPERTRSPGANPRLADARSRACAVSWGGLPRPLVAAGADVVRFEDIVEAGELQDAAVERVVALG